MRSDLIRLRPREHYVDLQRSLSTAFEAFGDGAIDARALNGRVAGLVMADPFSVLVILPEGPGTEERAGFLDRLAVAAGADREWRDELVGVVRNAPALALPTMDLLDSYAQGLPAFLPADGWLEQVTAIMAALRLDAGSAYADFRLAGAVAQQLAPLLGYRDYTRVAAKGYVPPGGTEEEWGAGYTGGTSLFVDLFAIAPARIEDARRVAAGAEALPPGLRAQVYGWMLDANFEYFMGVGQIPPELPPGIARTAPALAALHQDVTARLMAEFARAEQEMTEG